MAASPEVADEAPIEKPVSDTALPLRLVGIFRTDHSHRDKSDVLASALIAEEQGQANQYRINDTLPGNATLVAIYPFYVVLKRQGTLEALRFVAIADSKAAPQISQGNPSVSTEPPQSPASVASTAPGAVMTNEQIRNALRERALALQSAISTDSATR